MSGAVPQFPLYGVHSKKVKFSRYRPSRPMKTRKIKASGFSRFSAPLRVKYPLFVSDVKQT
jgi:hypothetical protein